MDYKESYEALLEAHRKLEEEIEALRLKKNVKNEIVKDMIFKAFHSASQLMAITKFGSGEFVDVNRSFTEALEYSKEEIVGRKPDDIKLFAEIDSSNKFLGMLSRFDDVEDYTIILRTRSGKHKPFIFFTEKVIIEDKAYLLTIYNDVDNLKNKRIRDSSGTVLEEIFETVSSYLALFSYSEDNRFFIVDLNTRVEEVEFISKSEVIGKFVDETPLVYRSKLIELLHHVRITGEAHKLAASPEGDDSEGYYMGFILTSGNILITWEQGHLQKQKEKAYLEHLIDSNPVAIGITDMDGRITMINKEFTRLFGYTAHEALNNYVDDLIVPDDLKEEALKISTIALHKRTEVKETVRIDKSGNRIYVSLIATSIIVNNQPVACIGIYRDVTSERKNQLLQEILYNISSAALNQSAIKDIYPIIVKELSKIWDTDNFFIAIYDNRTGMLSLPFFADEKDEFHEIPAKKTITGWVINNNKSVLLKENDLRVLEDTGEIDLVGTPCKVWMGVPLRADDNIIGVICLQDYHNENKFTREDVLVLEFISNQVAIAIQRRNMLDNLILARQKAEEAAQSKQQFMSTMSHEIRTPLNEVIGITNLLLQGSPREDQMDYIKTLRFSGNHLLTLVNDVLDYNKIESGKIVFEQIPFSLTDFINDIMRSYSFRSRAKNLGFDLIKANDLPENVIGDPIRLNQILSNLLSNALKFTREGCIAVTIRELENTGRVTRMEFTVRDTGIGIPKERQSMIFDSFTQASADTTRHYGGTGLGLAICKKLIELQGGEIVLESEPDKGSTFRFAMSFGIADKEKETATSEPPETYKGLDGKRVLVAEDNRINFFVANKFLTGWGIIVTHAENGKVALELLEKEDFDLVIMDLHMPVLDGIEATRIIRNSENPSISSIPVIALTAAIMSESHDKINDLNINDYVLKPFKPRDLFDKIARHIR
ncbi:MAG: PAS domain S-box protein [Bacteroidales bacterium]|nr:PAS domain S-box protein [Bacteroidales bacterium]